MKLSTEALKHLCGADVKSPVAKSLPGGAPAGGPNFALRSQPLPRLRPSTRVGSYVPPPGVPGTQRRRGGGFIREDWGRRKRAGRSPEPSPRTPSLPAGPLSLPGPVAHQVRGAGALHPALRGRAADWEPTRRPQRGARDLEAQRPEGAQRRPAAASQSHELGWPLAPPERLRARPGQAPVRGSAAFF